jgi:hypothetical protein
MLGMRPGPIARLALIAAATLGCSDEGPRSYDMHEHYRVQLDLPPVEAALWFADRYPSYFTSGEEALGPWLDELDPRDRDFIIAMGQTLAWAWIEHELETFESHDPSGLAREATLVIRHQTLNQLDLNAEEFHDVDAIEFNAWVGDTDFEAGVFARLVRGVTNCEGQNHLVALLLDTALEPEVAWMPEFDTQMAALRPGHDVVRLDGPTLAQPIWIDAWSNLPAFTLDPSLPHEAPALAELGDAPPHVVPGAAGRTPYPVSVYAESSQTAVALLVDRHAPTKPVDLDVRAPQLDEAGLASVKDPWKLYLFARILHVYDDPRADDLYRWVLDHHCVDSTPTRTFICTASTMFLERLNHSDTRAPIPPP